MKKTLAAIVNLAVATIPLVMIGCQSSDERLVQFARESNSQQSQQSVENARLNREVAANHRRMVEAVEVSRLETVRLAQRIDDQQRRMEDERKALAAERKRESTLGPIFNHLGMLLVSSLPLVACLLILFGLRQRANDDEIAELLVLELLNVEHHDSPRLAARETQRLLSSTEPVDPPF